MFYFRTIHLVFGLILIGAVKAVPMSPSGTTSISSAPLGPSRGGDPLQYRNDLIDFYRDTHPDWTDEMRRREINRLQRDKYQHSGWIQIRLNQLIVWAITKTRHPETSGTRYPDSRVRVLAGPGSGWLQDHPTRPEPNTSNHKGSPPPSPPSPDATKKKMLKEEAGVSEEKELMLRESIQRWSGHEVPWDRALGVVFVYDGRLEPGVVYGFDYFVSWVHGKQAPAEVNPDENHDVVFIQLDHKFPRGWSK
ncbi:hypothetical protein EV360DRAFT_76688 [Lentinula raphanica]|nr:hypothetical protein EV360DRAFT_76688 [Lentinula raphanica]